MYRTRTYRFIPRMGLLCLLCTSYALNLVPTDADGWCDLGRTLTLQNREDEAVRAFQAALTKDPAHVESHKSLGKIYGARGQYEMELKHFAAAVDLRPDDVSALLGLGVCYTSLDDTEKAEEAFRTAARVGPADARPALHLGRLLMKSARPAEAIASFYNASAIDAEYFEEVQVGVGTARAQQGRLVEAEASFNSALRINPTNEKLALALPRLSVTAQELRRLQSSLTNAVADVCGTYCQELVDTHGILMCGVTWEQGCGDEPPPDGFNVGSTVAQLCAHACAASAVMAQQADLASTPPAVSTTASAPQLTPDQAPARSAQIEKNWTRGYIQSASSNVILDCARAVPTLADSPKLASASPSCSWDDYERFLAESGLDWFDDAGASGSVMDAELAERTTFISTALSLAQMLRMVLGEEEYSSFSGQLVVDVVGWAFTWRTREEEVESSMTSQQSEWDAKLEAETRLIWGGMIGDTLRRLLPLVDSVVVRGYGPEAPCVARTSLREDGWLQLELHGGTYDEPSQPPPTLTLLENSGLHDGGFWPSDFSCINDKGCLCTTNGCITNRSMAVVEQLAHVDDVAGGVWSHQGVPLSCYWRRTIETLRDAERPVFATSYFSHEHLLAIENLRSVGANVVLAYPNGFREISEKVPEMDLLVPSGPIAEAMRDPYPRPWGPKEATYAATAAMWWRYRIEIEGYERHMRGARNSHVIQFLGGTHADRRTAADIQTKLQQQACESAKLHSMPARQVAIVRDVWRCA